ncbi:hypothetical protein BCV75_03755 [Xylella fastidiosa]|nr:hypothetical protein BCV75_03755 [Xylella fastidiosa]
MRDGSNLPKRANLLLVPPRNWWRCLENHFLLQMKRWSLEFGSFQTTVPLERYGYQKEKEKMVKIITSGHEAC